MFALAEESRVEVNGFTISLQLQQAGEDARDLYTFEQKKKNPPQVQDV